MDDPWAVKSVRLSGQYLSCMKINGVPLLPPVLSKECREEMQYYKLLAKEVEKRISILQPYLNSDEDSNEDNTDAPEIPECDLDCNVENDHLQPVIDLNVDKLTAAVTDKKSEETLTNSSFDTELYNLSPESMLVDTAESTAQPFVVDVHSKINDNCGKLEETITSNPPCPSMDIPERDYNCTNTRELLIEVESQHVKCGKQKESIMKEIVNFSFSVGRNKSSDSFEEDLNQNGRQLLNCKSFTGSLNNIHTESGKTVHIVPNLVRQQSYTLLYPSPQLLAHLEVQSVNLGVDMSNISMSESLSKLSTPSKKRRSWDLESAKVKWSKMAMELKQKNLTTPNNTRTRTHVKAQSTQRPVSPSRAKSVAAARTKYSSISLKSSQKSEPIQKARPSSPSRGATSNQTIMLEEPMTFWTSKQYKPVKPVKEPTSPKTWDCKKEAHEPLAKTVKQPNKLSNPKKGPLSPKSTKVKPQTIFEFDDSCTMSRELIKPATTKLISECEDPATKVRELYEKIQKQQLIQMASLVEKQKKEQMLLQQVFEEQNNLLYKQLKTICPTSPVEAKEAWVDKAQEIDRGPVSLSQLINPKPTNQTFNSPVTSTLTDSNKYINHCDNLLQRSRDISGSIKNQGNSQNHNGSQIRSPKTQLEGSHTRTNSPNRKSTPTSRRLNYDTSASSDRDYDPILTDRTNDTITDLNVTFPSDSEESRPCSYNGVNRSRGQDVTVIHPSPVPQKPPRSTDAAIKCMEQTIQNSINSLPAPRCRTAVYTQPTPKQQAAAAKIVAHAKGYLVRRLMKTARVQSTVQTIKDALLCALQLHQDREGIRGADVDLHRRLIQQITAACYSLHDTFITSSPSDRCAMIAADRSRRTSIASRTSQKHRHSDIMSQSFSGAFPLRPKRFTNSSASLMTQSNYESYSSDKPGRTRYMPSPRRRPWR